MKLEYALFIPLEIDRRIRRLRATVQTTIRIRLEEIITIAEASPVGLPPPLGPSLRFYAEGYRIFYKVESEARCVFVLELRPAFA